MEEVENNRARVRGRTISHLCFTAMTTLVIYSGTAQTSPDAPRVDEVSSKYGQELRVEGMHVKMASWSKL